MFEWTEDDSRLIIELLNRMPSPKPYLVFRALSNKMPSPAYELIVLRENGESIEVLLSQRPDSDPDWPSAWHYPGTTYRETDTSIDDAIARIIRTEIKGALIGKPVMVGELFTDFGNRGKIQQNIHLGVLDESVPYEGTFYNVDDLPQPFIHEQLPGLKVALEACKASKK
ncbi:MAG: hypothetical protein WCV85_00560 [Patescibacteria group bacterium]|jgi:hypothetical protein